MSSNPPTWEERVTALKGEYDRLRDKVSMDDVTRKLGDTATEIAGLPGEIAALREKGYAFAGYLERKVEVLAQQWGEVRGQVQRIIEQEINRVQRQFDEIGDMWKRLETQWSDKGRDQNFNLINTAIENAGSAADAARRRIEGLYGQVPENVSQTQTQIRQIQGYLKLAAEATVDWTPAEALFMVVEAQWLRDEKGKEKPEGQLYLTDQRLIFEQNEKVGGRFGFGGDKVQQVLFAVPVGTISEVKPEDKGVFGGKDLIHLKVTGGDFAETALEVKGGVDSKWYAGQLNRVITGEIEKERAIPVDQKVAEAVQQTPTVCAVCGASLPALVRGVTELTCEYCGTKVRV